MQPPRKPNAWLKKLKDWPEYADLMKSDVADLRNSSGGRLGGTILGAAFIDAAVEPDTQWAHLDIAGPFIRARD